MTEPAPISLEDELPVPRFAGHGNAVRDALEKVWSWHDDYGLLREMAADAVMARTTTGELLMTAPRLLQLVIDGQLPAADCSLIVETVSTGRWTKEHRTDLETLFDAWWLASLNLDDGEHASNDDGESFVPSVVLGVLAHYDLAPMVRWLLVWLDNLDGPGAVHLASFLLGFEPETQWADAAWKGREQQRDDVHGWARTEPVVYGLTMVGATHLEPDTLDRVLDYLIDPR